jgi:hypothetical protein
VIFARLSVGLATLNVADFGIIRLSIFPAKCFTNIP